MAWLQMIVGVLTAALLVSPGLASICPESCICSTTRDGLHRATCSDLVKLYKFTLKQKHHNINILDLSHNNITKLNHELDRLTEVVTLDLSTNGITNLQKFFRNAKKLVHLNLANNRIEKVSLAVLPPSVSSLDLTNNLLKDVPSDVKHLTSLEHLELEGNPLECTCDNLLARDRLIAKNVLIDDVKCASPSKYRHQSWLELKTKDVCKDTSPEIDLMNMMMGDQVIDAIKIGQDTTALKSLPLVAKSDLEDGVIIHNDKAEEDDDSHQFLRVSRSTPSSVIGDIEGSGDFDTTTDSDVLIKPIVYNDLNERVLTTEETIQLESEDVTEDPVEGSGEGSGFIGFEYNEHEAAIETTTPFVEELNPLPVGRVFEDDSNDTNGEYPIPPPPTIYAGGADWHSQTDTPITTEKLLQITRDTTISEQIRVTQASEVMGAVPSEEKQPPHKTGTYVCIAIIVILLVGLIGFAIVKGQMRKRRDKRLRQQKRDIEKASKEMVDMNKSLLGKPAVDDSVDKKVNGKYELVPTHENSNKKNENGELARGLKQNNDNDLRTDSPRDTNQNKSSSKDNNLLNGAQSTAHDTSFESGDSRKDTHSLSSEDIFVPMNNDEGNKLNGNLESDVFQPLINGNPPDSIYLAPSREYVPVYSPDMGRVRIKMTETPKPKTPVLVTRSKSNAGDIIITPALDSVRKSTT